MTSAALYFRSFLALMVLASSSALADPPVQTWGGGQVPLPADKIERLNRDFMATANIAFGVIQQNKDRFSEVSIDELSNASQKWTLDWRATEHIDQECPDESDKGTETRRPFCLLADGRTVLISSTYFESTQKDDRERVALAVGVILRVTGIRGTANRAIALRVADVEHAQGLISRGPDLPPNPDPVHGMQRISFGLEVGGSADNTVGLKERLGGYFDYQGAYRSPRSFSSGMVTSFWGVHGRLAESGGVPVFNAEGDGAIALYPVLVGAWAAIKVNQFDSYREAFFTVGLPILAIPIQLGGENYLLLRVNGGAVPLYAPGNGTAPGLPNVDARQIQFAGANFNAEVALKTGAFLVDVKGEISTLRDPNATDDNLPGGYHRIETVAQISKAQLLLPHDEVTLQFRHDSLSQDSTNVPGFNFNANILGIQYGLVF